MYLPQSRASSWTELGETWLEHRRRLLPWPLSLEGWVQADILSWNGEHGEFLQPISIGFAYIPNHEVSWNPEATPAQAAGPPSLTLPTYFTLCFESMGHMYGCRPDQTCSHRLNFILLKICQLLSSSWRYSLVTYTTLQRALSKMTIRRQSYFEHCEYFTRTFIKITIDYVFVKFVFWQFNNK